MYTLSYFFSPKKLKLCVKRLYLTHPNLLFHHQRMTIFFLRYFYKVQHSYSPLCFVEQIQDLIHSIMSTLNDIIQSWCIHQLFSPATKHFASPTTSAALPPMSPQCKTFINLQSCSAAAKLKLTISLHDNLVSNFASSASWLFVSNIDCQNILLSRLQ